MMIDLSVYPSGNFNPLSPFWQKIFRAIAISPHIAGAFPTNHISGVATPLCRQNEVATPLWIRNAGA
jgi:hypothetical protein